MKTHRLDTVQPYFGAAACGVKPFEVRRDDRDFEVGDLVVLVELDPIGGRTGAELPPQRITFIMRDAIHFGLRPGFAVLGLEPEVRH